MHNSFKIILNAVTSKIDGVKNNLLAAITKADTDLQNYKSENSKNIISLKRDVTNIKNDVQTIKVDMDNATKVVFVITNYSSTFTTSNTFHVSSNVSDHKTICKRFPNVIVSIFQTDVPVMQCGADSSGLYIHFIYDGYLWKCKKLVGSRDFGITSKTKLY